MTAEDNTQTTAERIEAKATELGLAITSQFVPWSLSRNAGEKQPSLNWKVTIWASPAPGRSPVVVPVVVLTTDYMAGSGHCPSYKNPPKFPSGKTDNYSRDQAIKIECETGKPARVWPGGGVGVQSGVKVFEPKLADVLHSLVSDAGAIDYSGFEEWASEYGYDADSRKAEAIYRACLDIGLKLRNALGEAKLAELREACQNY